MYVMPKATFYTHVAEPAVFSCRLAARAMRDSRVLVWSDSAETVARIDRDFMAVLTPKVSSRTKSGQPAAPCRLKRPSCLLRVSNYPNCRTDSPC